jgi:hypothetical protein
MKVYLVTFSDDEGSQPVGICDSEALGMRIAHDCVHGAFQGASEVVAPWFDRVDYEGQPFKLLYVLWGWYEVKGFEVQTEVPV